MFLDLYPPVVLLIVGAIFLVGGVMKGALGFGLPLITMSLLPLIVPIEVALGINALATPFNNFAQIRRGGQARAVLTRFRGVVIATAAGIILGALFVSFVEGSVLQLSLGVFVVLFALYTLAAPKVVIPGHQEKPLGIVTGLVGGIVGALTTANGPVYIMYLVGLSVDRVTFVSALGLFFIVTGVVLSASFLVLGLLTVPILLLALIAIPLSQIGMRIGFWVAGKVAAEKFRAIVLIALAFLGVNLIAQGLAG